MKVKFKKGDNVKVISGRYKGQEAVITKNVLSEELAFVEGVNIKKKTIKKREAETTDNFQYVTHPIHYSKLKKIAPKKTKTTESKEKDTTKKKAKSKK